MKWQKAGLIIVIIMVFSWVVGAMAQDVVVTPVTDPIDPVAAELVDVTVEAAESTASTLEAFLQRLTTTPKSELARILLVVGGVILLLVGWRVYDFIVVIAGFLIGASIAVSLLATDNTFMVIAALLIGGLIGAALSAFLYYLAVFVIGAYIGVVLTNAIGVALSLTPVTAPALLIGGIIGGIVLIGLSFEFLVLLSALVGAQMLSLGLGLDVTWTAIFAVVGVIVQIGLMRSFRYDFRRRRRPINPFYRPFSRRVRV